MKRRNFERVRAIFLVTALLFYTSSPFGIASANEVAGTASQILSSEQTDLKNQIDLTDIEGHWGESAIFEAVSAGFIKGYPDGTFKPDQSVTKAEFTAMLNRALQLRDDNTVKLLYTDVSTTEWYYMDIQKASYAKIIKGISDVEFQPGKRISREEAAVMMSRIIPKADNETPAVLELWGQLFIMQSTVNWIRSC